MTIYAMKRAALLLKEIAGGVVSSPVTDIYPKPIDNFKVELEYSYLFRLIGKEIVKQKVKNILESLDIQITKETESTLYLSVPPYRVDVSRPADIVEEILRIYGYNNVEVGDSLSSTLSYIQKPNREKINNLVAEMLSSGGFAEIMANSLTKAEYYAGQEHDLVRIMNPLSNDLNAMRKTLLFGGLDAIQYNRNRKNPDLKLYEFGNVYFKNPEIKSEDPHKKYYEEFHLGLFLTGRAEKETWLTSDQNTDFYRLKAFAFMVLHKSGKDADKLQKSELQDDYFNYGLSLSLNGKELVRLGSVSKRLCKYFDIPGEVFYADFHWDHVLDSMKNQKTVYRPVSRFPEVRRDLSMVLNKETSYEEIRQIALRTERKILRNVDIFDVYEGDKIEHGKKSYALSFILQDESQTLTDEKIDSVMDKLTKSFEKELGAQIRS